MLNKLSYPKKCLVLLITLVVFLLAAYRFSFHKTFDLRKDIDEKEKKITWLREKEKEIPFLRSKMALVEKVYATNDSTSLRDRLTAFISDFAVNNKCTVTEIPYSKMFINANIGVETNIFTIRGNFKELLELEYALENKFRILARVMSVRFHTTRDLQTKRKNLYLTLITQSFNQITSSKKQTQ